MTSRRHLCSLCNTKQCVCIHHEGVFLGLFQATFWSLYDAVSDLIIDPGSLRHAFLSSIFESNTKLTSLLPLLVVSCAAEQLPHHLWPGQL